MTKTRRPRKSQIHSPAVEKIPMSIMRDWIALQQMVVLRPILGRQLLDRFGSLERLLHGAQVELGATDSEWQALQQFRAAIDWAQAQRSLAWCQRLGIHVLTWDSAAYPALLREIPDPPLVLYVRGDLAALTAQPSVAVVGTRKATSYGRSFAERLVRDLGAAGVAIVSGLALGIDAVAHRAALAAQQWTIAVLASGVDDITPHSHYHLGEQIRAHGVLCSEFAPGTPPLPHHFPHRNRLISGLSAGVVVIEAAAASGTMSTARHAADQGRVVCAVPGPAGHVTSVGPHALIRDGAILVESAAQVLEAIQPLAAVHRTGQAIAAGAKGQNPLGVYHG